MKKKLAGLLAALMVLTMSTTVFAATSPTAEDISKAESAATVSADVQLTKTSIGTKDYSDVAAKAADLSKDATVMAAFELTAPENTKFPIEVTIAVAGISAGDSVSVLHKKSDGTWETISPATVADGYVVVSFASLSPVAVVRTATAAQNGAAGEQPQPVVNNYYNYYTTPSASTGNVSASTGNVSASGGNASNRGATQSNNNNQVVNVYTTEPSAATPAASKSNTSPKTGASVPVLPFIAVFAVTGIAVCTKKRAAFKGIKADSNLM